MGKPSLIRPVSSGDRRATLSLCTSSHSVMNVLNRERARGEKDGGKDWKRRLRERREEEEEEEGREEREGRRLWRGRVKINQ